VEERLPVVEMADCEADLHEPAQHLLLREGHARLLCDFDALGEVSALRVLHDQIQFPLGRAVDLLKSDDIGVAKQLEYFGLAHGVGLLLRGEICEIDLLDGPLLASGYFLHQEGAAVRPAAEQPHAPVDVALALQRLVLRLLHSELITGETEVGGQSLRSSLDWHYFGRGREGVVDEYCILYLLVNFLRWNHE
jgi:hypothetical protein